MFVSKKAVTYIIIFMFLIPSIILFNTGFIGASGLTSDTPPAQPSNPSPINEAIINYKVSIALSVYVFDADNDVLNVSFYLDGVPKGTIEVPSGSSESITIGLLDIGEYEWYATANDGNNATTSDTWSFSVVNMSPVADFTFLPADPTTIDLIQFTDASTDSDGGTIDSWYWDFGDDTNSSIQNPTHQYSSGGAYTVNLTVTDDDGNNDTTTSDITVIQNTNPPTAAFSYVLDYTSDSDWEIDFTDESTDSDGTIDTYAWDFGDGNTNDTQNPSYKYPSYGTYEVTLTVTDNDDLTDSTSKTLNVRIQTPKIDAIASSTPSELSMEVELDFSHAMDTASVESAFSITPSVSGLAWSWTSNNKKATVTSDNLDYSKTYNIKITTAAHDDTIFENNLNKEYTHSLSTGEEPGCVKLYIEDLNGNKLNPKVYVGSSLKGTASNGYLQVCMGSGTHTFSFELTDYPKITKSITITSGGSQSIDIVMSKVDFDSTEASMGFEFDLSEKKVPISGQFSIPISITPVQKFNPGETYQISVRYTNKRFSVSGKVPSILSDFLGVVSGTDLIKILTKGFAKMEGDTITGVAINTPVGEDSIKLYSKKVDVDLSILSLGHLDFELNLKTKGDINGQILSEGPVTIASDSIYFTEKTFSITIDEDAKPGEEVRIGIIPSYEVEFRLTGSADVDFPSDYLDFYEPEKQFYPLTGWTSPISIPSAATIGFIGTINNPPTANFSFTDSAYTTLSTISVTDNSNDTDGTITKWSWDFGNRQTSASQNPTYTYENPGTYTVTLTVQDDSGAINSINKTITIEAAPVELTSHTLDETVSGEVILSGTTIKSGNLNGPITKVEIKIGDSGTWETAEGTTNWKYTLDTTKLENGENTIHVRCTDGNTFSDTLSFNLQVDNKAIAETSEGIFAGGFDNLIIIVLIIAIVAVAAVLLFLYIRKSKSKKEKVVKQKIKKEKETPAFTDPKPALNLKPVTPKTDKKFIAGIDLSNVATADSDTDLRTIGDLSENPDEQIVKNVDDLQEKKVAEEPSVEQKRDPKLNFCAGCGAPIGGASNFCIRCGHKIR